MSDPAAIDVEQLLAAARAALVVSARAELDEIQAAALALAPSWTPEMASAAGLDADALARLVRDAHVEKFGDHYEPSASWRALMLSPLQDRATHGPISAAMRKLAAHAPPGLSRWRRLAEGGPAARLEQAVAEITNGVVDTRDPERLDGQASEILAWIDAARLFVSLARATGSPALDVAIDRAHRTASVLRRRARDHVALRTYLPRADQDAAFATMVEDPDEWCTHFVGPGGAGKTMLIRHIVADLCARRGIATARIDFDRLSPDFPFKDPGTLFENVATELAGWATDDAERALVSVRGLLDRLRLSLSVTADPDPLASREFHQITDVFREFFARVARGRPLVLILDTCEELAKYQIDDRPSPALGKTFEIVELLRFGRTLSHDERTADAALPAAVFPGLRVILAGRRILACQGRNYLAPSCPQPPRAYLRLHEVRGFDASEASAYLLYEQVPTAYHEAILAAAPEVSDGIRVTWQPPRPGGPEGSRHHPYDLHDLAMLATAPDPPTPDELRHASDPGRYVDIRILRRLGNLPLERALPLITRLGHVDAALLAAVVPSGESAAVQRALGEQDWIILEPWGSGAAWSIEPKLQARFDAYYAADAVSAGSLSAARSYLDRLLAGDPQLIDWQPLDAALRLRVGEPVAEQWTWWVGVEQRLLAARGAAWVADVVDRLLGRGLPAARTAVSLPSSVLALATLACARVDRDSRTTDSVHELRQRGQQLGPVVRIPALDARIAALEIETSHEPAALDPLCAVQLGEAAEQDAGLDATTRYALRAAYLTLIDRAPVDGPRMLALAKPRTELFPRRAHDDLDLAALGGLVRNLARCFAGQTRIAERELYALLTDAVGESRARPHGRFANLDLRGWLDHRIGAWIRDWGGEATIWRDQMETRDHLDRATRALLQTIRLAFNPLPPWPRTDDGLEVPRAESLAAMGHIFDALAHLERALAEPSEALGAARAQTQLLRQFRLWDQSVALSTLLRSSSDPADAALVAMVEGLQGRAATDAVAPRRAAPAWIHACWRSLRAFDEVEKGLTLAWWSRHGRGASSGEPLWQAVLRLDEHEATLLAQPTSEFSVKGLRLPELPCADASTWVAVALRFLALVPALAVWARSFLVEADQRLGVRRVAELALDEAEALALRHHPHSGTLFRVAHQEFHRAGDIVGMARSWFGHLLLGRQPRTTPAGPIAKIDSARNTLGIAIWNQRWDEVLELTDSVDMQPWAGTADLRAARVVAQSALPRPAHEPAPIQITESRLQVDVIESDLGDEIRAVMLQWTPGGDAATPSPTVAQIEDGEVRAGTVDPTLEAHFETLELWLPDRAFSVAWEAWLTEVQRPMSPRVRRVPQRAGQLAPQPLADARALVAHAAVVDWLQADRSSPIYTDPRQASDARFVHLVGNAREDVRSFGGTMLLIDDPRSGEDAVAISAAALRKQLAGTPLFLLQGTPWQERGSERAVREHVRAARRFGGELAIGGAAVLVLPAIGLRDVRTLIELVVPPLLDARNAEDLVGIMAGLSKTGPLDARDACLYAPRDWRPAPSL